MGIDPSQLAPWAQAQIARKLAAQMRGNAEKQAAEQEKKKNKYHNVPDSRNGAERELRFDSRKEARRYDELMLMLKAGKIHDLKLQPQFTLQEAYTTPDGVRVRAIRYVADFSYEREVMPGDHGRELVVEDVKGKSATKTRVYQIKRKLMMERFGIEIQEIDE